MTNAALEAVLRRDRAVVITSLIVVVALAWAYVIWLATDMEMGGMDISGFRMIPAGMALMMPTTVPWNATEFAFVFAMWAVMMVGMMTPSATPIILIYARIGQAAQQGKPFASSSWFASGYLLAWIGFALVATFGHWALERGHWLTPEMAAASGTLSGIILIAAGLYQWTPLKNACLRQCQMPLQFIQRHGGFRPDAWGSLALGARHGAYCVGCCWVLMALLFVAGVMNVLWIAALTILVLVEKVVPAGRAVPRVTGAGFYAGGVWNARTNPLGTRRQLRLWVSLAVPAILQTLHFPILQGETGWL
jgi:predicted metal-binding membrane protein